MSPGSHTGDRPVVLGITASTREFSIAARTGDGRVVCPNADEPGMHTASHLAAVVAGLFAAHGLEPEDLGEIRLDLGPGSYTGLRVAVAFARVALAFRGCTVTTTTSLELAALASMIHGGAANRLVRPVLDARRDKFHHAGIRLRKTTELVDPPRATELDVLLDAIGPGELVLAEAVLHERLRETVRAKGAELAIPNPFTAALLFEDRIGLRPAAGDDLEPLYLMGSYAE